MKKFVTIVLRGLVSLSKDRTWVKERHRPGKKEGRRRRTAVKGGSAPGRNGNYGRVVSIPLEVRSVLLKFQFKGGLLSLSHASVVRLWGEIVSAKSLQQPLLFSVLPARARSLSICLLLSLYFPVRTLFVIHLTFVLQQRYWWPMSMLGQRPLIGLTSTSVVPVFWQKCRHFLEGHMFA